MQRTADEQCCECSIANHHIRGRGVVRWVGDTAIIDDEAGVTAVDSRVHKAEVGRLGDELARAHEQIRQLTASEGSLKEALRASERARLTSHDQHRRELEALGRAGGVGA